MASVRSPIETLPPNVLQKILVRLSPAELIRCTCVLKSWSDVIHSRSFYEAHLKWSKVTNSHRTILMAKHNNKNIVSCGEQKGTAFFSSVFSPTLESFGNATRILQPLRERWEDTQMVGFHDGLVCLYNLWSTNVAIWNPSINRFRKLPYEPIDLPAGLPVDLKNKSLPVFGLGYDSSEKDFKVIRIVFFSDNSNGGPVRDVVGSEVKVYSYKLDSWKIIKGFPYTNTRSSYEGAISISLDDTVHWLSEDDLMRTKVVALDLATETYKVFSTPFSKVRKTSGIFLHELGGCLCLCFNAQMSYDHEVWRMDKYGVDSWSHLYTVKANFVGRSLLYTSPLHLSSTGERVLLLNDTRATKTYLIWYDFVKKTKEQVTILGLPSLFKASTICVANLALLGDDPVISERVGYELGDMSEGSEEEDDEMSVDEGSDQDEMSGDESSEQGQMSADESSEQDEMSTDGSSKGSEQGEMSADESSEQYDLD